MGGGNNTVYFLLNKDQRKSHSKHSNCKFIKLKKQKEEHTDTVEERQKKLPLTNMLNFP